MNTVVAADDLGDRDELAVLAATVTPVGAVVTPSLGHGVGVGAVRDRGPGDAVGVGDRQGVGVRGDIRRYGGEFDGGPAERAHRPGSPPAAGGGPAGSSRRPIPRAAALSAAWPGLTASPRQSPAAIE